jgi:hypothetical protein
MPLLRKGSVSAGPEGRDRPRVVSTNNAGHQHSLGDHMNPTLDFTDLDFARACDPLLAYSRSKVVNLMFTYEPIRRHGDALLVSARHLGQVRIDIGRYLPC